MARVGADTIRVIEQLKRLFYNSYFYVIAALTVYTVIAALIASQLYA